MKGQPKVSAGTKAYTREARRTPGFSFFDWLHGYVYARWIYQYIGLAMGEHPLAKRWIAFNKTVRRWRRRLGLAQPAQPKTIAPAGPDPRHARKLAIANGYHGKVIPLESARRLLTVNREIDLTNLEQVIPYSSAKDIILRNPDHIAVLDCPCRSARENPCLPLDVCLVVGEPFTSFVTEHHAGRARQITATEAIEIVEAEHERGHVQHAFFKDAMLGRFYAICNCCSCCCGAMQAHRNGIPMLAASGFVAAVEEDLCIGCEACTDYCQFEAISMDEGLAVIDLEACMGCGVCRDQCVQEAIELVLEPANGMPLEIADLMAQAAQPV